MMYDNFYAKNKLFEFGIA